MRAILLPEAAQRSRAVRVTAILRLARSQISISNSISLFGTRRASLFRSPGVIGRLGAIAGFSNSAGTAGSPVIDVSCIAVYSVDVQTNGAANRYITAHCNSGNPFIAAIH